MERMLPALAVPDPRPPRPPMRRPALRRSRADAPGMGARLPRYPYFSPGGRSGRTAMTEA